MPHEYLDSLYRSVKLGRGHAARMAMEAIPHVQPHQHLHTKMFYAQRNVYLTGFTLALAVVLYRYVKVLVDGMDLEERLKALEISGLDRRKAMARQIDVIEELQNELKGIRPKVKEAEASMKQSKSQQREFDRLIDRINELEAHLSSEDSKSK